MAGKNEKTNVMRTLDAAGISYKCHCYGDGQAMSGAQVAEILNEDPDRVFKTLVTVGRSREHYVFMVPVNGELNLKKAASAVGEKSIEMIRMKELLPLTGYVHGGCSPIGMKKQFVTVLDETAFLYDTILFSAGKIGAQVELDPNDLMQIIPLRSAELT